MKNRSPEIKPNGRKMILLKNESPEYVQPEYWAKKGDMYLECYDGWFQNTRVSQRANILEKENWQESYSEVQEELASASK